VAFVLIERGNAEPIVPLGMFRSVTRSGAHIGRILIVGAMFSTFYFLSQYLQNVLHFTAVEAGMSYIPLHRDVRHRLRRRPTGAPRWQRNPPGPRPWTGHRDHPAHPAGDVEVPDEQSGVGSGLVNTAHQIGGSVGLPILAGVFIAASEDDTAVTAQVSGFQTVFHVASGFYAVSIITAVVPPPRSPSQCPPPDGAAG